MHLIRHLNRRAERTMLRRVPTRPAETGTAPSRFDFIILWRIFKQPRSLNLSDLSYEDLIRRFQDLVEDNKVGFAVLAELH